MVDLDAVFDAVAKLPFVDSTRMGIAGASYGGYAVNWIIGHTRPVQGGGVTRRRVQPRVDGDGDRGAVVHRVGVRRAAVEREGAGAVPDSGRRTCTPHKIKTPTLVITNELDFRVPVDQGLQMFTVAAAQRRARRGARVPGRGPLGAEGEQQPRWHEAVFGWMKKYLQAP